MAILAGMHFKICEVVYWFLQNVWIGWMVIQGGVLCVCSESALTFRSNSHWNFKCNFRQKWGHTDRLALPSLQSGRFPPMYGKSWTTGWHVSSTTCWCEVSNPASVHVFRVCVHEFYIYLSWIESQILCQTSETVTWNWTYLACLSSQAFLFVNDFSSMYEADNSLTHSMTLGKTGEFI